jgi:hypothetical protein
VIDVVFLTDLGLHAAERQAERSRLTDLAFLVLMLICAVALAAVFGVAYHYGTQPFSFDLALYFVFATAFYALVLVWFANDVLVAHRYISSIRKERTRRAAEQAAERAKYALSPAATAFHQLCTESNEKLAS